MIPVPSPYPNTELPASLLNIGRYMWELFSEAVGWTREDTQIFNPLIAREGKFAITESFTDFLSGDILKVALKYQLPEGLSEFRVKEPLACAFYLVNSLHETLLPEEKLDKYGRYPYAESIQCANNITEENYVQSIFEKIHLDLTGKLPAEEESRIFWSHDIDYLYSAWKSDLITARRNKDLRMAVGAVCDRILKGDRWNNLGEILALEKQYNIRSVFFWLTRRRKFFLSEAGMIDHADYTWTDPVPLKYWKMVMQNGSVNGLHKSAFDSSFREELNSLPTRVNINRNHFLRAVFPKHYYRIEEAGLQWDATLGFAEHPGFRNSFGRPFRPYNLTENRPFRFRVLPLHLMDATLTEYMGKNIFEALEYMKKFVRNHSSNTVIGILFHNSHYDFIRQESREMWNDFYSEFCTHPCFHFEKR